MTLDVEWVDAISASPTVRLDMNDGTIFGLTQIDVSPPPLKRSVVSTLLSDGNAIPSASYDNRVLGMTVEISTANESALATQLQTLHRELARPTNLLRWVSGNSAPVFFRTFKATDYVQELEIAEGFYRARLAIPAEPFALGLRQNPVTALDINNDPAAASNGMFADVTGVLGDVDTPALLTIADSAAVNMLLTVAVRSRGTPSSLTRFRQAESMTLDASVTSVAVGTFSGGNGARVAFGTTNDLTTARLTQLDFLGTASVEHAGIYRLMARVARSGGAATDDFEVKAVIGPVTGQTVTVSNLTGPQMVDLGLFGLAYPPVYDGYGAQLPVDSDVIFYARRTSGSGSLDVDYILALPADTSQFTVDFGGGIGLDSGFLDGPQDTVYRKSSGGAWITSNFLPVGGLPSLVPNQTNRLYFVRSRTTTDDQITDDFNLSVSYWPRYLYVAP